MGKSAWHLAQFKKPRDFTRWSGDLSIGQRNTSRFSLFTIPTIACYEKYEEITIIHFARQNYYTTSLSWPLLPPIASATANGPYSSWQCCHGRPHSGGKACQYCWLLGQPSKEAFICEGRPAGARWRLVDDRSLLPSW